MNFKVALFTLALSAIPFAQVATAAEVHSGLNSPMIVAERDFRDNRDLRDDRRQIDRRENWRNDRRENWRNDRREAWRNDRREAHRRVWIPGHWESGFLGIGRKWVEGRWEER